MSGGSSSKQETTNQTNTHTNTSTIQGIEDGSIVAGGDVYNTDSGAFDVVHTAIEQGMLLAIDTNDNALALAGDVAQDSALLVAGAIDAINQSQVNALDAIGSTAMDLSKAQNSESAQTLDNALKYGAMAFGALALGMIFMGVMKK